MKSGGNRNRHALTPVWIKYVDNSFHVFDANNRLIGNYSKENLLNEAEKKNWHLIPLVVVQAVDEFANGGWRLTRPMHCSQ